VKHLVALYFICL
jgi:hypothetical protein